MRARELPPALVETLRRARRIEMTAEDIGQRRRAIHATGSLMLAAVNEGWYAAELARAMGIRPQAAQKRVTAARERYGDGQPALVVDEAPRPPPKAFEILETPLAEREWLSLAEAAEFVGRGVATIRTWRRFGLLPNTQEKSPTWMLYLRADLVRVMSAPEYKRGGVDRRALLAVIRKAGI